VLSLHPSSWRRRWFATPERQARLARPVISVGNISMGGRGKSPLVGHIARLLVARGERPAILSRGYGRRTAGPGVVVVSDGRHLLADLDRSGDEPMMLAREAPGACVLVCADRHLAGALAERRLGATVHLLDDGFQHVTLGRDADIVVVTADDLRGRPVPAGRLREPAAALEAADAFVIDDRATDHDADASLPGLPPGRPVFRMHRHAGVVVPLDPDAAWPPAGKTAVVVAGIVRPERLAASAAEAGWSVCETIGYGDHHRYTPRDLDRIARAVTSAGADGVLTTAKDAARLMPFRPLPVPFGVVPLTVTIEPAAAFEAWLADRMSTRAR
jgi:tetraacyldisaccharide 4'-kinase